MIYANPVSLTNKLSGRISVVLTETPIITGISYSEISEAAVDLISTDIENGFMDIYLAMIYEMPLLLTEPMTVQYLRSIAEDLICAEIIEQKFPQQVDGSTNNDGFSSNRRTKGLNNFQALFNGTGIFVFGADAQIQSVQNDPNAPQMQNKNIILKGERLKEYIGYDYNNDGIGDTDIFKRNAVEPSFYMAGNIDSDYESEDWIVDGVQVRQSRYYRNYSGQKNANTVSFW